MTVLSSERYDDRFESFSACFYHFLDPHTTPVRFTWMVLARSWPYLLHLQKPLWIRRFFFAGFERYSNGVSLHSIFLFNVRDFHSWKFIVFLRFTSCTGFVHYRVFYLSDHNLTWLEPAGWISSVLSYYCKPIRDVGKPLSSLRSIWNFSFGCCSIWPSS